MCDLSATGHRASLSGRSAFVLEKDCDGWRSAEDYMIEFGNGDGRRDRIISHFDDQRCSLCGVGKGICVKDWNCFRNV